MPVHERKQMPMPLHLLRLLRQALGRQPPLRPKLPRVLAPELLRRIDVPNRHRDLLPLRDRNMVRDLAVRQAQRPRERDHVVLGRDARRHRERRVHPQDLVHDCVEVVQPRAVRELLPARVRRRELLLELFAQPRLRLWLPRQLDQGPLRRKVCERLRQVCVRKDTYGETDCYETMSGSECGQENTVTYWMWSHSQPR